MRDTVKIIIADDHKLILDGLASLVESIPEFKLIGKAHSGMELIDHLSSLTIFPDVIVVDIEMPGMDGVETVKQIRKKWKDIKIVALTMHQESHFVSKMIAAGANGYFPKNIDRQTFIDSVHRLLTETEFITTELISPPTSDVNELLTIREKEVLKLIAKGKSNKEIAEELFISDRTADTHRTNIKRKLKVSTLAQLIEYANANLR